MSVKSVLVFTGSSYRQQWTRFLGLGIVYAITLIVCRWLSFAIRFDFKIPANQLESMISHSHWHLAVQLVCLAAFGQFRGLLSYFSIPDFLRLTYASAVSTILVGLIGILSVPTWTPRGVLLLDFILSLAALTAIRMLFRILRERFLSTGLASKGANRGRRVVIIGAGDVGATLAKELLARRGFASEPVAFFDDSKGNWNKRIHGVPVLGPPERLLDPKFDIKMDRIILAVPGENPKRLSEILKIVQRSRIPYVTVPSLEELATGKIKVLQLREVQIQDLLGRSPVSLQTDLIHGLIRGRIVMVTGAGGSIGSELCRQILAYNPERVLMYEQSEFLLFQIEQELREVGVGGEITPLVGDVCDKDRLEQVFLRYKPTIVFHAAAHKHVPMMENQPAEAVQNNTLGTVALAEMSIRHEVKRFILISTDKAINPTNVMGATKRLAEIYLQSRDASLSGPGNQRPDNATRFMAVRFGNVLGSSGSVIPTFRKQIASGGPVKVTHPDVTRYFMTIPEAVGLVLQSATQGTGGEIFVLDMGKPVRIIDLARQLIELSGFTPDEDIRIEITGLRPGEKLFEELSHSGENITTTSHPKIMRFVSTPMSLDAVKSALDDLTKGLHTLEAETLKHRLKTIIPEYRPYLE